MKDSRAELLGKLREKLGRNAENAAAAREQIAARIAQPGCGPRPTLDDTPQARVALFTERAGKASTTIDVVRARSEVPQACARYLQAHRLSPRAVAWPELMALDWAGAGLEVADRPAGGADSIGITGVFCALAETGSLVVLSGPGTPATTSLLPETHIAIVPCARIVADMEALWRMIREECRALPRAVNVISGPSRTGDIEQTLVLGAHGPYRVHVVLIEAED